MTDTVPFRCGAPPCAMSRDATNPTTVTIINACFFIALSSVMMPALRSCSLAFQDLLLLLLLLPFLAALRVHSLHLQALRRREPRQVPDEMNQLPARELALFAVVAPRRHAGEA